MRFVSTNLAGWDLIRSTDHPSRVRRFSCCCLLAVAVPLMLLVPPSAVAQQRHVVPREPWGCYFGGQSVTLNYLTAAPIRSDDRLAWTVAVRDQVVARRETTVQPDRDEPERLSIEIELPVAKPGVVLPLTVVVSLNGREVHRKPLWVFPDDPFADSRTISRPALDQADIALFDPEKKTAEQFEQWKIPFAGLRNVDAITALDEGVLIIGEGVSFRDYRALPAIMAEAAARGVAVICLAPSGGAMAIPGAEGSELPPPGRLSLRRNDVIRQFDERFDSESWSSDGRLVASRIRLTGERTGITGEVSIDDESTGERGWPWFEAEFPGGGRLVVCGFAIIDQWDSNPTPRYLLAHLLTRVLDGTESVNDVSRTSPAKGPLR